MIIAESSKDVNPGRLNTITANAKVIKEQLLCHFFVQADFLRGFLFPRVMLLLNIQRDV